MGSTPNQQKSCYNYPSNNNAVDGRKVDQRPPIKNVVFDVGNVLIRWDPKTIITKMFPQHPNAQDLTRAIFKDRTWLDLNLGLINESQALMHYHQLLGIEMEILQHMPKMVKESLEPLPDSIALLQTLHQANFNLYALTDNTHEIMAYLQSKYDFWPLFKGIVISAQVGLLKPDPKIYNHLLETYDLKAAETVFIDDLQANVAGAKALGMHGVQFENIMQCVQDLKKLNIQICL